MDHGVRLRTLELLSNRALASGGWPLIDGGQQVATEATAFAVLAGGNGVQALLRGRRMDGSWAPFQSGVDSPQPSPWCTGLALVAVLQVLPAARFRTTVDWLCRSHGTESHWIWRWKFKLADTHVDFDPDKFGWSWVPGTVSWVIPTAIAMIALRVAQSKGLTSPESESRVSLGAEMLIDRMCPAGGWNAGNARVFGVPLEPHIDATAIALLALRAAGSNATSIVQRAFRELTARTEDCLGAESLAWTVLALHTWREHQNTLQEFADRADQLERLIRNPHRFGNNSTLALGAIALDAWQQDRNPFEVEA